MWAKTYCKSILWTRLNHKSVIVDESSTENNDPEIFLKSINTNKGKDAIYETDHEDPLVTYFLVINKPRYLTYLSVVEIS